MTLRDASTSWHLALPEVVLTAKMHAGQKLGSGTMAVYGAEDLLRHLRVLGIAPGDGVFVHSALGQVGHVIGGPRGIIDALMGAVGPDGLIGMPGFSRDAYDPAQFLAEELDPQAQEHLRAQVPGYDPERSNVRANGAVPEAFRSWPGTLRSAHPTSSVLLNGRDAARYISPHDAFGWATGQNSPWGGLRHRAHMKILLIGVGWNRCSALHAAESLAAYKRTKQRLFKWQGDWITAPDVADDLDRLFPSLGADFERTGAVTLGSIGDAPAKLCSYASLLDFAVPWFDTRNAADGIAAYKPTL